MKFLLPPSLPAQRVGVLRDILMRSPLRWVVAVVPSALPARVLAAGTALRRGARVWGRVGKGSKGGREVGTVRRATKNQI